MRYLVTGGAGFLGSHLSKHLLSLGHEVLCVDNFLTGHRSNVKELQANSSFELLRHDVTIPLFVEVDGIFNLACPASPIKYQLNPTQTMKTSVLGAINLLGLAKRLNVPILQASTSEIYGDPQISPQHEGYWGNVNPIGIRSCYDEGKRAAETLFFDYSRQFDVQIKVARIFNTYGPRMAANDGRVVSNFINQALQGSNLTVYGDGSQTRSLCYVDDLILGLVKLMQSDSEVKGPINLGNPDPISMLDLAKEIISLCDSESKIIFEPLPSDDPTNRLPDIAIAKAKLEWSPQVNRKDGLGQTVDYFKSIM